MDKCVCVFDGVIWIVSCINMFGLYRCNCSEGYRDVNNLKDGKNCIGKDRIYFLRLFEGKNYNKKNFNVNVIILF